MILGVPIMRKCSSLLDDVKIPLRIFVRKKHMPTPENPIYINTFDCDGVVAIEINTPFKRIIGLRPEPNDIIITGRSFEERPETERMLAKRSINNRVCYSGLRFEEKTRQASGEHKARTIKQLQAEGYTVVCHFEDDEVQAKVIRNDCPEVHVILLVHDLTEKENVRHDEE
jgi:hypothetical protein